MSEKKDSFYDLIIESLKNINSENGIIILPILFLVYIMFFVEAKEIEDFFDYEQRPPSKEIIIPTGDTLIIDTKTFDIIDYKYLIKPNVTIEE